MHGDIGRSSGGRHGLEPARSAKVTESRHRHQALALEPAGGCVERLPGIDGEDQLWRVGGSPTAFSEQAAGRLGAARLSL